MVVRSTCPSAGKQAVPLTKHVHRPGPDPLDFDQLRVQRGVVQGCRNPPWQGSEAGWLSSGQRLRAAPHASGAFHPSLSHTTQPPHLRCAHLKGGPPGSGGRGPADTPPSQAGGFQLSHIAEHGGLGTRTPSHRTASDQAQASGARALPLHVFCCAAVAPCAATGRCPAAGPRAQPQWPRASAAPRTAPRGSPAGSLLAVAEARVIVT